MRINYVLIDYENVQPEALSRLDAEHFKVMMFVGASQAKVTFETASALQKMGSNAEYIKISGNGPNALDFHIAFYIGQIASLDPTGYFHIVSKDAGFDPLIQHLKARKIFAARSRDIAEIPLVKATSAKTTPDKVTVAVANLIQRGASRPRTVKTLLSTLSAIFLKQVSEEELNSLLQELQSSGYVTVSGTKVLYSLSASPQKSPES